MSPRTNYLCWLIFLLFLTSGLLSGQRPDVVFLNDSSKLAGQIEVIENEVPAAIYFKTDAGQQRLTAGEIFRFVQYDQKTGKKVLEALPMTAQGDTEAGFYQLISDPEKRIKAYQKVNKPEYYLLQDNGVLVRVPDEEKAFLAFVQPMMGGNVLRINGHKIRTLKPSKITRLTNFLESDSGRFPARSFGFSFSYSEISADAISAGQLPRTITIERIATDIFSPSLSKFRFEAPEKINGRAFFADAFVILPLSSSMKFDLRLSGGYRFKEFTGLQEFESTLTSIDLNIISAFSGRAHLVRFGSELNYRMGGNKLFPFISLGIGAETPIKQENILFNYLVRGEIVNTNRLELESYKTTLLLPSYSVGVEVPLTTRLWWTLEIEGGFEWSIIDSSNPYYGLSLSVNY